MLEIQVVTRTMDVVNVQVLPISNLTCRFVLTFSRDMDRYTSGELSAMRSIMNGRRNVLYVPNYLNCVVSLSAPSILLLKTQRHLFSEITHYQKNATRYTYYGPLPSPRP